MGKSKSKSKKLNIAGTVWLVVALLLVLVLATAALFGSFAKRYVSREKNVIGVMVDANDIKNKYDDPDLPIGAVPGIENGGDGLTWDTETSVDLFKTTYTDAEGKVSVESSNGDKVIAPGTANDYIFTIKNTGNISLDYSLSIEGIFKVSDEYLPFFVRLRAGDEWLVGGEDTWVHVDELDDVFAKRTLGRGKSDNFVFEWQWPYASGNDSDKLIGDLMDTLISADANDTYLGDLSLVVDTEFILNITTSAVVTPGAIATFIDGTPVLHELIFVLVMLGIILACIFFLILFIFFRRRIYFVGFVSPSLRAKTWLDDKDAEINGTYVIYPRVKFGKHEFAVSDNSCNFKLKRAKVETGVMFEMDEDVMTVTVDRRIRALELHFLRHFHGAKRATIETDVWAAIDKKHNVYSPNGITPPDPETKINRTEFGMTVNEDSEFSVE